MNSKSYALTHQWTPLIARVLLSALFLADGFNRIFNFSETVQSLETSALTSFAVLAVVIAVVIEIGGGAMILFGYKARLGANLLALFVVLQTVFLNADFSDPVQQMQFMTNLALAGGLLYVAHFGAGPKSLDQKGKVLHGESNPVNSTENHY